MFEVSAQQLERLLSKYGKILLAFGRSLSWFRINEIVNHGLEKYQAFDEVLLSIFEKQCCPCSCVTSGTISRYYNLLLVNSIQVSI